MRFLRLMLASAALMFAATGAAYAAEPKEGVEYKTLDTPVRAAIRPATSFHDPA